MKKNILLFLFIFLLFSCRQSFAVKYSEDNAAYWYQKAFNDLKKVYEHESISKSEEVRKIIDLKSLKDFNQLKPETKKLLADSYKSFLTDLKKAKSLEKCIFWEMALNDKDEKETQFNDLKMIHKGFRMANALAWYAISINKPDSAGVIWQTMLNISIKISEHNLISIRSFIGGMPVKLVIANLESYFENGASSEFKSKFVKYLKKWPKSIFDLADSIKVSYDYQKSNVELYAKDQKYLACFFGADFRCLSDDYVSKPVVEENRECASIRRIVQGAIEMYQMDESSGTVDNTPDFSFIQEERDRMKAKYAWKEAQYLKKKIKEEEENEKSNNDKEGSSADDLDMSDFDEPDDKTKLEDLKQKLKKLGISLDEDNQGPLDFSKLSWDKTISILENSGYLKKGKDYSCPANGTRIIKASKGYDKYEYTFDISCNCGIAKNPNDDFNPDSEPMKKAKKYQETQLEKDKKQLFEYYDMLMKVDHTKPMTDKEMLALNSAEIPEYKNNVLLMWLGLGYDSFRKSFDDCQKLIDDFVKKYDN